MRHFSINIPLRFLFHFFFVETFLCFSLKFFDFFARGFWKCILSLLLDSMPFFSENWIRFGRFIRSVRVHFRDEYVFFVRDRVFHFSVKNCANFRRNWFFFIYELNRVVFFRFNGINQCVKQSAKSLWKVFSVFCVNWHDEMDDINMEPWFQRFAVFADAVDGLSTCLVFCSYKF